MFSIIVSSINDDKIKSLAISLEKVTDSKFELIIMDNKNGTKSLSCAYNEGAKKATYPYLIFLHEDVQLKWFKWSTILVRIFDNNPDIGVIGVAGGTYKSKSFSPAWFNFRNNGHRINIVQPNDVGELESWVENPNKESLSEVVVVDGVFMCCRKSVWEQYNFDENVIQGFHFYDMDFCLGVRSLGYKNYVTHEILLEHFSSGKNNLDWYKHGKRVHQKWENALPQFVGEMTDEEIKQVEYQTFEYAYNLQLKLRVLGDAFISMCQLIWQRPFKGQNLLYLKNWMKQLVYAA